MRLHRLQRRIRDHIEHDVAVIRIERVEWRAGSGPCAGEARQSRGLQRQVERVLALKETGFSRPVDNQVQGAWDRRQPRQSCLIEPIGQRRGHRWPGAAAAGRRRRCRGIEIAAQPRRQIGGQSGRTFGQGLIAFQLVDPAGCEVEPAQARIHHLRRQRDFKLAHRLEHILRRMQNAGDRRNVEQAGRAFDGMHRAEQPVDPFLVIGRAFQRQQIRHRFEQ